jgi:hypothetical protein
MIGGDIHSLKALGFLIGFMPQGEFEFGGGDEGDAGGVAAGWPRGGDVQLRLELSLSVQYGHAIAWVL